MLRHYGRKQMAPDARYIKEVKARKLWDEAMARLHPVLVRKNIVRGEQKKSFPATQWTHDAVLHKSSVTHHVLDGRV